MAYSDDLVKAGTILAKQGKAFVTLNLVPYANDIDFAKNPPSCRVTVTARDPVTKAVVATDSADIPTTVSPYTHRFTIKVQETVKSLGRFIGLPQYRALSLDVTAEPIGGFETLYEPDISIRGLQVQAGSNEQRNVALKPRYAGSRLDTPTHIDKPLFRPPQPRP